MPPRGRRYHRDPMAKKKRKRHRRPVAPPVHSAPDVAHGPSGPPHTDPGPTRPEAPAPPAAGGEPSAAAPVPPARTRPAGRRKPAARRRKGGRRKTYLILAGIVVLIAGAIFARQWFNSRRTADFNELARAAGCGELQVTDTGGAQQHLAEGQTTNYEDSPPTHGPHATSALPAGVYDDPFTNVLGDRPTIYQAVHSLEHAYVILWYEDLTTEEQRALERRYEDERKVIVVPYPQLEDDTKMALTAWGRSVKCEEPSARVADAFIDLFRGARSAPEPNAP